MTNKPPKFTYTVSKPISREALLNYTAYLVKLYKEGRFDNLFKDIKSK